MFFIALWAVLSAGNGCSRRCPAFVATVNHHATRLIHLLSELTRALLQHTTCVRCGARVSFYLGRLLQRQWLLSSSLIPSLTMNFARHSISATRPVVVFDARFDADCELFTATTPDGFAVYRTWPLTLIRKRGTPRIM
jgi:hypothetical protein